MNDLTSYHGNPNLKPLAYQHDFSKEEIAEYVKCKDDPVYFIENYVKIITLDKGLQPFNLYPSPSFSADVVTSFKSNLL